MAPPPNSGDATNKNDDDPLGGMDPMAWLESLAKRQGAKAEELTTSADLDVPLPPAGTVIDEPGYTPGYDTTKSSTVKASAPEPAQAPEPAKPPVSAPPSAAPEPAASTAGDDMLGGMDPMAWLESLAKRQGAKAEELTTSANLDIPLPPPDTVIDEPGYTPGYDTTPSKAAKASEPPKPVEQPAKPAPEPVAPAQPAASTAGDDLLGGMDPMAWLESLAKRQGAKAEELTTSANLDIPMPPPDTVIDEPGYTPGYDTTPSKAAEKAPEQPKPAAQPAKAPEPVKPAPAQPAVTQPTASAAGDDLLGGMDPMAWLESLAKRQGAKEEELVTAANLDVPLPPPGTVVDEPGYVDYDPFGGGASPRMQESARAPEPAKSPVSAPPPAAPEPVASAAPAGDLFGGIEDPLAWLESLTAAGATEGTGIDEPGRVDYAAAAEAEPASAMSVEQAAELLGIDMSSLSGSGDLSGDPLAWLESLTSSEAEVAAPAAPTPVASEPAAPVAEAGGASSDINEVKQWLEAQARNLEQTRVELEEAETSGELAPAQPADELPDWLRESMAQMPPPQPAAPPLAESIATPVAPGDLPDWLVQPTEADATLDANAFLESMMTPEPTTAPPAAVEPALPAEAVEDLEALTRPATPEEEDSWAVALDEEHVGLEVAAPDWYLEARKRFEGEGEGEELVTAEPEAAFAAPMPEPEIEPAVQAELPDWLRGQMPTAQETEPEPAAAGELPDWLTQQVAPPEPEAAPAVQAELPDWLSGQAAIQEEAAALPGEIPDWLQSFGEGVSAEPAAEAFVPPAEPAPTFAAPTEDWSAEVPEGMPVDLPDWLQTAVPEPAPDAPEMVVSEPLPPVTPPVAPAPAPQPVKAPEPPAPVRQPESVPVQAEVVPAPPPRREPVRPTPPPATGNYAGVLQRARELVASEQHDQGLQHYQTLIDNSQLLEETRSDLRQLIDQNPSNPRLHRLLGDTHMRLGDLQEALDTYRKALDQL